MSLIVRKYGGSSVATSQQIKAIAEQIKKLKFAGNELVVVVSAMGETTNQLLSEARDISLNPDLRELDMLLSIGERKSISLMSLALNSIGVDAVSYTGSQVGIITDNNHGNASILEIKPTRLKHALSEGKVVVIAGYQGVSTNKEITTLGRGGTDTTAVAVAAALNADRCELMKDVDGLYSIPPKYFNSKRPRDIISHEEFLEIASCGSEILSKESIQIAQKQSIKIGLGNTLTGKIGTIVVENVLSKKGVSQIIEQECFRHTNSNKKLSNSLVFKGSKSQIIIDLDPDSSSKNSVLFSLLGKDLLELNLHHSMLHEISAETFQFTDEKLQFLFKKDDYKKHSKKLIELAKKHLSEEI